MEKSKKPSTTPVVPKVLPLEDDGIVIPEFNMADVTNEDYGDSFASVSIPLLAMGASWIGFSNQTSRLPCD